MTETVWVRRSGGLAGRTISGQVDLDADERGGEVRALIFRIDFTAVGKSTPQPDRFVYEFGLGDREVTVQEQQMTEELRRLASLVLGDVRPAW